MAKILKGWETLSTQKSKGNAIKSKILVSPPYKKSCVPM
jgi:hypothetical protein